MRIDIVLSGLAVLLAASAADLAPIGQVRADELRVSPQQSLSDITGSIDARAGLSAGVSPVEAAAGRARLRFSEARAAMDRGMLMRDAPPNAEMAALETNMKGLAEELSAIERLPQSRLADSAKEARDRANDWYQAGLKIMAPPANGLTELPSPVFMKKTADAVAASLDGLVVEASADAPPAASMALPKAHAEVPRTHRAGVKSAETLAPKPISKNEANWRLMREGLPLLLPIVGGAFTSIHRDDAASPQGTSHAR